MPARNIVRLDAPDSYYHVYARGHSKQAIFRDESDFTYFEMLFARYLQKETKTNKFHYTYPNFSKDIELLAYCLMGNHFHLLVYQNGQGALTSLMRSLMTSYSRYFNEKYELRGSVFETRFKSSVVGSQRYLDHISRYIHLNPRKWRQYKHSSLRYYYDAKHPEWLQPKKISNLFVNKQEYLNFLNDYDENKDDLEEIKHLLADN